MKAVILAGGFGTRISEESAVRPKPMVEIGGRPMIWHIMKLFAAQGVAEFIVCCGYKGWMIKEYFANYWLYSSDMTIDLASDTRVLQRSTAEPWTITLVDTGESTMTGGRLRRVREHVGDGTFFMTYGDGVSDVDLSGALETHRRENALATLTAVQPPGRFGALSLHEGSSLIDHFAEKPDGDGAWINGGFFVLEPAVFDHIDGDDTVWEREPLERLARAGRLAAYRHTGYWQNMDTLRDRALLEEQWVTGRAPWKIW